MGLCRTAAAQWEFKISLSDFGGIRDVSVISETVSVEHNGRPLTVDFSYDGALDQITLAPDGGGNFASGFYTIRVNHGADHIADQDGNKLAQTTFLIDIADSSLLLHDPAPTPEVLWVT